MSIYDNINNITGGVSQGVAMKPVVPSETYTFYSLPESVQEMQTFPIATLESPYYTAALTVCALCAYAAAPEIGIEMLNFLKGPQPLSQFELSFLRDRFMDKKYVPFSYFAGATPENNYTPAQPFMLTVSSHAHSYDEEGYASIAIQSGGADSPRFVKLRAKGNKWYLWEQYLLPDVKTPAGLNPWA